VKITSQKSYSLSSVEDNGSRNSFCRSHMHINERAEVVLTAQQRRRRKPSCIGGSLLFIVTSFMAATHIYREDPPRITASRNRLGLSLLKCIRHWLVAIINGKRKSQTCEALSRISTDHSCTCHAPTPLTSPHPIWPGECMHVFLFFAFPPHSYKYIKSNSLFK
jgi:hypothetical protein